MAWWVARIAVSANAWGPQAMRDSSSALRGRRRGPAGATRTRRRREEIPVALGGHDVACAWPHLARPWQCRCCHRTAARRSALSYGRCPGSAVRRWARSAAAAAVTGEGAGGGHYLLLTGNVVWRWRCGANACVRAHNLTRQCPGRAAGFLVQARQRLLLGLHPRRGCRLMQRLFLNLAGPCRSDSTVRCRQRRRLPRRRPARGGSRWVEWPRRAQRASSLLGSRSCARGSVRGRRMLLLLLLLQSRLPPHRRPNGDGCTASSRRRRELSGGGALGPSATAGGGGRGRASALAQCACMAFFCVRRDIVRRGIRSKKDYHRSERGF